MKQRKVYIYTYITLGSVKLSEASFGPFGLVINLWHFPVYMSVGCVVFSTVTGLSCVSELCIFLLFLAFLS